MTKSENLLKRITRIADAGTTYKQGRRVLTEGGRTAILPAMLQEIDETILARELTFYSDTGNSITLVAKGRRLWRVCTAKPKSLIPKGTDLVAVNLSDSNTDEMRALAKLMHKFAETAKSLSVSIAETEPDSDYSAMGLSVRILRDTWGVSAEVSTGVSADAAATDDDPKDAAATPGGPASLQEFVDGLSNEILASAVMADDTLISSSGSDKQIKLLQDLIKEHLGAMDAEFKKLRNKASPQSLIILNRDNKYFIISARMKNQTALIVCKHEKMPRIVTVWQQSAG